jgi:hypothetical protein
MAWVTVGMAVAGAIAGKAKNDAAQSRENSDRKLAAETQRYSPWTGMQAGPISHAGSAFGDIFSGGVGGAMMGNSVKSGFGSFGGDTAAPVDAAAGTGYLGAPNYSAQLGKMKGYTP